MPLSRQVLKRELTPQEVYEEVGNVLEYYLELVDPAYYDAMASWILATYRVDEFNAVPYLCFMGPKASGKTTALRILDALTLFPLYIDHPTDAALFRNAAGRTIIMDEVQDFLNAPRSPLYGLLNNGYTKGSKVVRMRG